MQTENATLREATDVQQTQTDAAARLDGLRSEVDGTTRTPGPSVTVGRIRGSVADGGFRFEKSDVKHDLEEFVLSIISMEGMTHSKAVLATSR